MLQGSKCIGKEGGISLSCGFTRQISIPSTTTGRNSAAIAPQSHQYRQNKFSRHEEKAAELCLHTLLHGYSSAIDSIVEMVGIHFTEHRRSKTRKEKRNRKQDAERRGRTQ